MRNEDVRLESKPPQHLSYEQVAAELCVSRRTVERWVEAGILPAVRFGRRILRISRGDLVGFIDRAMAAEGVDARNPRRTGGASGNPAGDDRSLGPQGPKEAL